MNFFVFKQKTAYEMRISDWSSDVCSSDLLGGALGREIDDVAVVVLDGQAPVVLVELDLLVEIGHRDVMDQLIVGALEEGRVDRHHRLGALAGDRTSVV